jgi:hypothetical protein
LEGAPPGLAEAVGVKMVQPPMHYTSASSRASSPRNEGEEGGANGGGEEESYFSNAYDEVARSILSEADNEREGNNVIHSGKGELSDMAQARLARRRRAKEAIVDCGGKIGIGKSLL